MTQEELTAPGSIAVTVGLWALSLCLLGGVVSVLLGLSVFHLGLMSLSVLRLCLMGLFMLRVCVLTLREFRLCVLNLCEVGEKMSEFRVRCASYIV